MTLVFSFSPFVLALKRYPSVKLEKKYQALTFYVKNKKNKNAQITINLMKCKAYIYIYPHIWKKAQNNTYDMLVALNGCININSAADRYCTGGRICDIGDCSNVKHLLNT